MTGVYSRINRDATGTEQVHKVWDIVTTCIRHNSSYDMIMLSIYMINTRYIPNRKGIYLVYHRVWYIFGIYLAYLIYSGIYQAYASILLVVGAEVVGMTPYRLARPHTASVYENTLVSNTEFRHMVYDRYIPGI
jgi:hypothetical protein